MKIERIQTGVRIEKRLMKVMKALAERLDIPLGELIEGIALHAFDGKTPFSDATLGQIQQLKSVYGLELDSSDAHRLSE
jgi:hypothetical protein